LLCTLYIHFDLTFYAVELIRQYLSFLIITQAWQEWLEWLACFIKMHYQVNYFIVLIAKKKKKTGLEVATDTVANATNMFSLMTKNSGLVATLATRFMYDLDLN